MRRVCFLLLLALLPHHVSAQQRPVSGPQPQPQPAKDIAPVKSAPTTLPPMPLQVKAPTQRAQPFDRVMYVLDVSGSMRGQLADAISVTDVFCSDGFQAAVVTFTDTYIRWGGVKESHKHEKTEECGRNCLKPGWAWMPTHRLKMFAYLHGISASGGTNPTAALDYAIKHAPAGTLIVFISDGDFVHKDSETDGKKTLGSTSTVRQAQAWRRKRKLAPVQILVWATSEADSKHESLVELAKLGGGGLWRASVRRTGPW